MSNATTPRCGRRWLLSGLGLLCLGSLGTLSAGDNKLPTADDVKQLQAKYQAEEDALTKSGRAKLFPPQFLEKAEVFAKKAAAALKEGRLLQAKQGFGQARWQLPYLGPTVPDHVSRVLGTLRLRHCGGINQLVYSPDRKWLATGSADRSVKIWDMANGHEQRQFVGHGDYVRTVAWSPDGKLIASAGGDDYIKLWNPTDGKVAHTLRQEKTFVSAVVFSPDSKYLACAWGPHIHIFDAGTGKIARSIDGYTQRVQSLTFTTDGKIMAAAIGDGTIQLFEFAAILQNPAQREYWGKNDQQGASYHVAFTGDKDRLARCYLSGLKVYSVPQTPNNPVGGDELLNIPSPKFGDLPTPPVQFRCSVFSKDGKTLFTGGSDGIIRLYNANTGQLTGTLKGHNAAVTALVWNRDFTELASSSEDHTVRLWPFDIVSQSREFAGHKGEVWMAALSPDGQRLVSASADRTLKVWDTATGNVLHTLEGHKLPVTVALFSPDGSKILSASGDRTLKLWDADKGKEITTFKGHDGTVTAADFSSDGKKIVSGSADKTIKVWDPDAKELQSIPVKSVPTAVLFDPDGKQIASGHIDQTIQMWDAVTGKSVTSWIAHAGAVTGLSFGKGGQLLASCGIDGLVKVWPMANAGNNPEVFAGHKGTVSSVALRADGKLVLSAGADGVVKLWKVGAGGKSSPQDFLGHKDWVSSVAFSKDGYFFVSASMDKTVRLWELTSKEIPLLSEHTGAVKAVAVSTDGTLLASAATDQTIKIWDLKSGEEKMTLRGHAGHAIALAFAPNGQTLYSSGTDRNILAWDLTNGQQLPAVKSWTGLQIPAPVLQVTPDAKKLLAWTPVGPFSTKVKIFDLPAGTVATEGVDQNRNVLAAAFTPDGKTVALAAADGSVRIYLVDQNRMEVQPGGDWFNVKLNVKATSVALARDGKTIAAGNDKGEIKIADVGQRNVLHSLNGHTAKVRVLVISPDGKLLASSGDDNVIKLWDTKSGKMLRQWDIDVPEQIDANFTPQLVFTPDSRQLITANANTTLYVLELP